MVSLRDHYDNMAGKRKSTLAAHQASKFKRGKKKDRKDVYFNRTQNTYLRSMPLGGTQKVILRYSDYFQLNPGVAGSPGFYCFSLNGCYDPNITGVGHQPRGFDQLMTMYDHYTVIGATVELYIHAASTAPTGGRVVSCVTDTATSIYTTYDDIWEYPTAKVTNVSAHDGGQASAHQVISVNPNEYLGRSKPLADPQLKGSASSNPSEQCFLQLFAMDPTELADIDGFACRVVITYTTILQEPKLPVRS